VDGLPGSPGSLVRDQQGTYLTWILVRDRWARSYRVVGPPAGTGAAVGSIIAAVGMRGYR